MIAKTHCAGVSTTLLVSWDELVGPPLQSMEKVYLQDFYFTEIGYLMNSLEWLSRDVLLFLFGITLFALIISGAFLLSYKRREKHQKTINKSIIEGAEDLSNLNAGIHRFISIVSHDLRSPLNSISAISEILAMDANQLPSKEIEDYAGSIHDLATRINHLVNNMLDANNIEQGDVKLDLKSISTKEALTDVYKSLQILGNKKSIKTTLDIEENIPPVIADNGAFFRVIENLINNAYKFSERGSQVKISAEHLPQKNKVKISIQDEGPGFTEDDKANLYTKFSKLSAKPTANEKSTGLGLFIVYKLIKRMNGEILLDTKPGEGSVFSVILDTAS